MRKIRLLECVAICVLFIAGVVNAQAQTFGTAKADNVTMYDQGDGFKANLASENGIGTVSYRVVNVGKKIWAYYTTTNTINDQAWAAQLRSFGTDGVEKKREMNLQVKPTEMSAYNMHPGDNADYYKLTDDEMSGVKLQSFVCFAPLDAGDIFTCSDLISYTPNVINNAGGSSVAPVMNSASAVEDGNNIKVTMSATPNGSTEFFYYISDVDNNIEHIAFSNEFSFVKSPSTLYNLKVVAVDYDGNISNSKTAQAETAFDSSINIALGRTANASDGSAANAVDGNTGTLWQASTPEGAWLTIDLAGSYNLSKIQLVWETAYGKKFDIYTSLTGTADGDWVFQKTIDRTLPSANNFEEDIVLITPARYIKYVNHEPGYGTYGAAVREFRVYASSRYIPVAEPELTSVSIGNVEVIEGEEVALVIIPQDQGGNLYASATVTGVVSNITSGASFELRDGVFYAKGLAEGTYTITATAVDGGTTKTGSATLTVKAARKLSEIVVSTNNAPFLFTKYAANSPIELIVACKDQYGSSIAAPEDLVWNTGGNGTVAYNSGKYYYTASAKGSASIATVVGNGLSFDVVTDAANVALNKTGLTANEGATDLAAAVDGNLGNACALVPNNDVKEHDGWIIIDLEDSYIIELVDVIWEGGYSANFTVDYSGSASADDFVTKYTVEGNTSLVTQFNDEPSMARRVRIRSTLAATGWGAKIHEVRVFGKDSTTTSIPVAATDKISFYPNPAIDMINITGDVREVAVYSLQGQLVLTNYNTNTVDVSGLTSGMYIIRITDESGNNSVSKLQVR